MRKFKKKMPGGKTSLRNKRAKAGFARCANCKKVLHGIPRLHTSEARKVSKSKRNPQRGFGGYYCGSCTKEMFRNKARGMI